MSNETLRYDDAIVRKFVTATMVWGAVGMLVAVIFAFAGNGIFAAVYYCRNGC